MPSTLPPRASLEWLKKTAKQNLARMRRDKAPARLADAQLAPAREYGFSSWRALKAHVEATETAPIADGPGEAAVTAFFRAVGDGQIEQVRAALEAEPGLIDAVGPHPYWGGRPQALHVAIETKRRDMFELLLERGADVDGRNEAYDRWSPLMLACQRGQPDMRDRLIERGARVGLAEALLMADDARVEELLRPGRDALSEPAPNAGSILAFARTPFAIDRLLELGVPADELDHWGTRPIEVMSRIGPEGRPLVEHMMRHGIRAAAEDHARIGDMATVQSMVEADPAIARREPVLLAAVDGRNRELVAWLLAQGADPNARSDVETKHSALHSAAWNGDLEMARLLVEAGADPHLRDSRHGSTPRGWAETALTITNNARCEAVANWLEALAGPG